MHQAGRHLCRSIVRPILYKRIQHASLPPLFLRPNAASFPSTRALTSSTKLRQHSQSQLPLSKHTDRKPLFADPLNPPSSTLPPPLVLPSPSPSTPWYKHYYTLGRTYLSFYKTGLKALYANAKLTTSLSTLSDRLNAPKSLESGIFTRAEYHFLMRTRRDVLKLPAFGLLFLACGEFTPLLVPFVSGIVPRIVWVPGQWEKARSKAVARRGNIAQKLDYGRIGGAEEVKLEEEQGRYMPDVNLREGRGEREKDNAWREVVAHGAKIGAWPRLWDVFVVAKVLPCGVLVRRLERRAQELRRDDWAIQMYGGVGMLDAKEVELCLDERGVDWTGIEEGEMREVLKQCLKANRRDWSPELKGVER